MTLHQIIDELDSRATRFEDSRPGRRVAKHIRSAIDELRIAAAEYVVVSDLIGKRPPS